LGASQGHRPALPAADRGRRGEPAIVIMSVQDFIRTVAPTPDWLDKVWTGAKQRGLDKLIPAEIDAEITLYRHKDDPASSGIS
jgi:hypothetical protein